MDDPSIRRVGAVAALGVACAYLLTGVFAARMPAELQAQTAIPPHQFWSVLAQQSGAHLGFHVAWIAAGLFGVGAVPALSLCAWPAHPARCSGAGCSRCSASSPWRAAT